MLFLPLIFLLPILIFGASVTRKVDGVECTAQTGFDTITCAVKLTNLQKHLDEWESISDVEAVKEACKNVEPCLIYLKCIDEKNQDLTTILSNHCKSMIYLADDFNDCYEILNNRKTSCFDQWDPFPGLDETGDVYVPTDKEKYCNNYFGANNCMRKEVGEQCNQTTWTEFKNVLSANEKNCNFADL